MNNNIDLVLFGAKGDLSERKLFPALYQLDRAGLLGDSVRIAGLARQDISSKEFIAEVEVNLKMITKGDIDDIEPHIATAELTGFYEVGGNAASQSQFYVTDSTEHFLTGSLYFYAKPNYDSILPAAKYLEKDIKHIMETVKWK